MKGDIAALRGQCLLYQLSSIYIIVVFQKSYYKQRVTSLWAVGKLVSYASHFLFFYPAHDTLQETHTK